MATTTLGRTPDTQDLARNQRKTGIYWIIGIAVLFALAIILGNRMNKTENLDTPANRQELSTPNNPSNAEPASIAPGESATPAPQAPEGQR